MIKNERYNELVETIKGADQTYYNDPENVTLPDSEYDSLFEEMLRIEQANPDIIRNDSPSQNLQVGGNLFDKVTHARPMLSLAKITTVEELEKFVVDIGLETEYEVTPKLDGMALSLDYGKNGNLIKAVSRGDGEIGENLTDNVKHVGGVPTKISTTEACSIRGEVVISPENFELIKDEFANPRNAAAGAMRSKDPLDAQARHLEFHAYDLVAESITSSKNAMDTLAEYGFSTPPYALVKGVVQAADAVDVIFEERASLPYEIDGVVIKVNGYDKRAELGNRSRSPRWATAYKVAGETAVTKLLKVEWQVGKSGIIAPIGILRPVQLGGTTISRVTLHNLSIIKKLGVYEGCSVVIRRAGDVIPYLVSVVGEGEHEPDGTPEV